METPNATHVQRLIRDYLDGWRQFSAYAQRVGAFGTVKLEAEQTSSTLPAPPVEEKNIKEAEPSTPSKTNHCPEWSENVTDLVTNNTPYDLDEVPLVWKEFLMRKARHDEDGKWIEEFKSQLDRVSGGADSFQLHGHEVASYKRNGNLNLKRLESEHPEVVSQYTRMVAELKFDREAFESEEPELFAAYRAKVFRLSPGATFPGLE